jgi:UDP-N-acetyl-D-mannosaminuronate dehydrogenase
MEMLESKGSVVKNNDNNVSIIWETRDHLHFAGKSSVRIEDDYDLILLSTDHSEYKDFDFSNYSCPLVDTRNCIQKRSHKYYQA